MNPVEQRQRFTAVQRVEQQVADLQTLFEQLVEEGIKLETDVRTLATHTQTALDATADYLDRSVGQLHDDGDKQLRYDFWQFRGRTFWQRLRWIVMGA